MEHTSLYRKYRPQTFDEIIGQDHVVKLLRGSIANGTIAHAYIFAGGRGTGKTSIARIFAREVGTASTDLYEIDAASNTGVDDIRALNDSVYVLPFESKYKIYLLDEAHMLSRSAFNALLKTIEEPPEHVIFILATTETEKLPETIVSRCQLLQFNKPGKALLVKAIQNVAKNEGIKLDGTAADIIAILGDGSFRDTLGTLQKVLSAYPAGSTGGKLTAKEVEEVTGAPRSELVNECLHALDHKDSERGLKALRQAVGEQVSVPLFLQLVLDKARAVLLMRSAPGMKGDVLEMYSEEDAVLIQAMAARKDSGINSKTILELLRANDALRFSPIPEIALELALIAAGEKV